MRKLIRKLVLMIVTVALVVAGVVIFFGYKEYQLVIQKKPIDTVLIELKKMKHIQQSMKFQTLP
ncbi:hypothetical protein [Erysipelothrix rhusiopathiae]|uniref:hypothetical protein n=1 Tax=Erysipelothrix rhusiopathiae TaxID=1648 RepID=UPI000334881C|nr:hypothetical protein [Erysipelothrix rhusiopathiae]AGN23862.1 hypothetical protein K210_01115 [Erysipelothrix rhusiopathiae SY1027]AMS11330.1 hypothetical protein A2I91_06145 [Erysipelothrix rhusiopathiae]AOO67827.1 hypothetical protein BC346_05665 [Erysipelothrix rhusiopathiae]MDE8283086.1 hypothetical protein [Erysipelothrix rhusiopathiae]